MVNPLNHPICLTPPAFLTRYSTWHGHVPFGMYLVDVLKPETLVELGVEFGFSYLGFCQAVKSLGLNTQCYGVDTWQGDPHTGAYGAEVLSKLKESHDPQYGEFSHLMQTTFDQAVSEFADQSIDLLHIDGYHTYEAVRHDFETWLPKVRPGGVILFHDTNVREKDFGVYILWEELKQQYATFEFFHSQGLGVLLVGEARTQELQSLFSASPAETAALQEFFSRLGDLVSLWVREADFQKLDEVEKKLFEFSDHNQVLEARLGEANARINAERIEFQAQLIELQAQLIELQAQLNASKGQVMLLQVDSLELAEIKSSTAWKLILLLWRLRLALFPPGSFMEKMGKLVLRIARRGLRRRPVEKAEQPAKPAAIQPIRVRSSNHLVRLAKRAVRVLKNEGIGPFVRAIFRKIFYFMGLKPASMSVQGALKAITTSQAVIDTVPDKQDIIFFPIIDWEYRFQRPQQLACQFAKAGHRVFYVSTTFQEIPAPIVWQIQPSIYGVILPGPREVVIYSFSMDQSLLEQCMLNFQNLINTVNITDAICMVDLPFWHPLAFKLREAHGWKVIYDCMDYHADFPDTTQEMLGHEEALSQGSDLVLASARLLLDQQSKLNPKVVFVPNAADFEHFYRSSGQVPQEIRALGKPVIGYYGALSEWFDFELVQKLAKSRPEWNFVLIGRPTGSGVSLLDGLANIKLLGEKLYSVLPDYLHQFDVCIIPFKKTPLTDSTNPVKMFEYLSAGKPVVTSNLFEISHYAQVVHLADSLDAWLNGIENSLLESSPALTASRMEFARSNSWESRYTDLSQAITTLYPKVSILIVTFNNLDYTRLCLHSIYQKTGYPNFEVILVDNASSDDTPGFLTQFAQDHADCRVQLNEFNLGFAAANNQAAAQATGEILVFLNNDTVVTPGWLSGLVRYVQNPQIGMIGPVTNWSGNESRIDVAYTDLENMEGFARSYTRQHPGKTHEISMLAFFCVAIRTEVWKSIGPLDEQFGIGMFEDDDYALRVRLKDLKIAYAQDIFVHHWGRASFSKLDDDHYQQIFKENKAKYEAKWRMAWKPHKAQQK